jgi:hypothetical protein
MSGSSLSPSIGDFLLKVTKWASRRSEIVGIVLVGSHSRGQARLDSDVDLVLILEDKNTFMDNEEWTECFGSVGELTWEDWGKVQSLRVSYRDGMEVEFGLTGRYWLASPIDEGTSEVLLQGVIIIYDPNHYVSRQLMENGIPYR